MLVQGCSMRSILGGITLGVVAALLSSTPARAQLTGSGYFVPETENRSGAVTRYVPMQRVLPPDPYRENFYDTQWAGKRKFWYPNFLRHGGIYGMPWKTDCVKCYNPSFSGLPGSSSVGQQCGYKNRAYGRWIGNYIHPFKPVCGYYDGGCYSPVYDLDPIVPGPGAFPWPFLFNDSHKNRFFDSI